MEKAWAQRAGLGWIGKHSNLVSARHGSWLLLGEVLTTADMDPDEPGADLCGTCTLCIRACPTGAITEPYVVDARRCLSYLTIEQKGKIPEEFQRALGNRIRSEEHTSELQSPCNLVCRLLLEKKKDAGRPHPRRRRSRRHGPPHTR